MLAEMKQKRLNRLRELGITLPIKGTLAQGHYDAKYYRLDLNLNDTTEIISGSVYMYAEALIDGFNVVELNFFDNPEMYVDSIKSNDALLYFMWSSTTLSPAMVTVSPSPVSSPVFNSTILSLPTISALLIEGKW